MEGITTMNIGETDADGWTYVRFGDAAKAAQDGTHDCETKHVTADEDEWKICYSFSSNQYTLYRMREKARTITVTHAKPIYTSVCKQEDGVSAVVQLFEKHAEALAAHDAINAAMEQS